ncbi:hypothetical protein [Methylobacterium planeticum]|uniref:Uncharacterized protein n=1 Tax=Methylobacterium planeticum TaxID=2615211 RepID=A0A6N6MYR2_9HYPH|nr:hypothetical protein [Methylobacterium planeticum]KAB1075333.1 hypothetical protein F6X51_05490 [Methylobacterium planeticum]
MSARVLSFFRPAPATSGDWSQQELAEFYRVEAASLQAGLRLSLERGLSDEGDPWLVFCRDDGEVFLHFARVDGSYVIVSDMVGEPLIGPDFRALLSELVARNPSVLPIHRDGPGGTGARHGAQILMHPAALLAAIVATTCLLSTMNEAVASELDSGAILPRQPLEGASGHFSFEPLSAADSIEPGDGHSARTRIGEQRELAAATAVVMACIACFLDQSANPDEIRSATALSSAETLVKSVHVPTETASLVSAEQKAGQEAQDARWATHQDVAGEPPTAGGNALLTHVSPREAGAILLSTPGASIVTLGPDGSALLARSNAFEGAAPLQFVFLTTPGMVRLVAPHAGDAASAPAKAPTTSIGSAASTGSSVGLETSAAPSAAGDAAHSGDLGHPVGSEKVSGSAPVLSNNSAVPAGGIAQSSGASPNDGTTKLVSTAASDTGSSITATTKVSGQTVASGSSTSSSLTGGDAAASKSLSTILQDTATLSPKVVSSLLHALIGDTAKSELTGDIGGSSTTDLVGLKGAFASTLDPGTGSTKLAVSQSTIDASSSSSPSPVIKIVASATTQAATGSSGDGTHSELPVAPSKLTSDASHTASADSAATVTKAAAAGAQIITAAGSAASSQAGNADLAHIGNVSDSSAAAPALANTAQPTLATASSSVTAGGGPAAATGTIPVPVQSNNAVLTSAAAEAEHTDALHAVSALVSSSNTITKAVSLSLTTGPTPLDAAQLRIIDAFMAATPNLEIRATATTLEIYDTSMINDPNISAMTWDLGGGSIIKIVGIGDGHAVA